MEKKETENGNERRKRTAENGTENGNKKKKLIKKIDKKKSRVPTERCTSACIIRDKASKRLSILCNPWYGRY